jgi:hypothetical protein
LSIWILDLFNSRSGIRNGKIWIWDKYPQAATMKEDSLHREGMFLPSFLLKRFLMNGFGIVFYNIYLLSGVSSPDCWPG